MQHSSPPAGLRRLVVPAAALAAVALLVTACTPSSSGTGAEPAQPGTASAAPSAGDRSAPPIDLGECASPPKDAGQVPTDLSGATWAAPSGFTAQSGYGQLVPAEGEHTDTILVLTGTQLDLLGVVHYPQLENGPVVDACATLDVETVQARIEAHAAESGAPITVPPTVTTVAGASAVVEERRYPDAGFELRGYWIYGTDELLHISCQWTDRRQDVLAGCDDLLASLVLA